MLRGGGSSAAMRALLPALILATLACASSEEPRGSGHGDGGGGATGGGGGSAGAGTGGFVTTAAGGSGGTAPSILYVHSNTRIYAGDPAETPLTLTAVGDFDCIGGPGEATSMTDVAVNAAGDIWAISATQIYRVVIDGGGAHCVETIALNNPQSIAFYGLTFAPKGTLDPTEEVLIAGNSAGELWSVDAAGNLELHGTLGIVPANDGHGHAYANAGEPWELSGDIAFFENGGSPIGFATVRDCPNPPSTSNCNTIDTLVELDVEALAATGAQSVLKGVRGQVVRASSCNDNQAGYGSVFGIAAWLGTVYGFSRQNGDGFAIEISNVDGAACLIAPFAGSPWAGAGVTTVAPIIPPPQ
jgi:hypothetical protein